MEVSTFDKDQQVMASIELDDYKKKCRQLEEDNQLLLKYNLER
jgi:hypothetical protein